MFGRITAFLLTASIVCGVSALGHTQPQELMTRHVREAVIAGEAQYAGRLAATQVLHFDMVLAPRHLPELENFIERIYDPSSPSFRQFLTVGEFTEQFGPSQEDYDALLRFAEMNNLQVIGGSRDGMDVLLSAPVAAVEKAFHVTMGLYLHPTESRTFYAPDREPTVDLPFSLWHISGLDNYALPHAQARHMDGARKKSVVKGSCPGGTYCGSDMRAAYYGGTALTGKGQTVGLLEFAGYDLADLQTYFKNVHQTNNVPVIGISTDGSSLNCSAEQQKWDDCDREQIIDMVQAISMAPGLAALNVYVNTTSDTAMLSAMSTHNPLDAQLSSSWTWQPADPRTDDPFFLKFAAQGQNYFQAAGDYYAYCPSSSYVFPADDAYVTSVGGTDLLTESAGGPWASEMAWEDGGGGYFKKDAIPIPAWQRVSGVITAENQGSKVLRNGPDVAAEANYDFYACGDQVACQTGWGGTSFAAPMWAGYMALVNEQAASNGKPRPGFINLALYALGLTSEYGGALHDIVKGNNGLPAVPGFDLATGWGSPNGSGLITALLGGKAAGGPAVSLSAESLQWGSVEPGKTAPAKTVTLSNTGDAALNISSITVHGNFALKAADGSCSSGSTVAASARCTIEVTFSPTQRGTRTGYVSIADNGTGSPQKITLKGTGK